MIRIFFVGLIGFVTTSVLANDAISLSLNSQDLDRLGVTLQEPRIVTAIEIASGPAEVTIPPAQEAVVASTVSGVLSRMLISEGDFVSAGQPLAEIVSTELLELQREYIEASLAADLARMQLERDRGLYSDGIIAERRVQESSATERSATATRNQVRQQLMLAGVDQSELDRLSETHELNASLTLRAPFDSFVVEQRSPLGARVNALDPVYHVADLSELWLELHVAQEKSNHIEPGMRVIASTTERTVEGEVQLVGRVADSASQTILVRASIDNKDPTLRAGQYLTARIMDVDATGNTAIVVPSSAIVRIDSKAYVFGGSENEIAALPVEIFAEDAVNTYVRGEINPGIRIAVTGIASLKSVLVSAQDEGP